MAKVSIVILNYNAGDFLKKCLQSIDKNLDFLEEIIVVDNASADKSLAYLKKLKEKKVKVIFNRENSGFSKGNNIGLEKALKTRPDYILFLNPDTLVNSKALETVFQFMEASPEAGIATCRLELANGKLDEACHRGFPTPWRAFCHFSGLSRLFSRSPFFSGYTLGHLLNNQQAHEIDACTGAFLFIRSQIGNQVNWWDEDYFWYGEDLDFCYRVKKMGWKIIFLPQVKITHYRGISSGIQKQSQKKSQAKKETRIRSAQASTQAMRIFYQKHYLNQYPCFLTKFVFWAIDWLTKYRLSKIKK